MMLCLLWINAAENFRLALTDETYRVMLTKPSSLVMRTMFFEKNDERLIQQNPELISILEKAVQYSEYKKAQDFLDQLRVAKVKSNGIVTALEQNFAEEMSRLEQLKLTSTIASDLVTQLTQQSQIVTTQLAAFKSESKNDKKLEAIKAAQEASTLYKKHVDKVAEQNKLEQTKVTQAQSQIVSIEESFGTLKAETIQGDVATEIAQQAHLFSMQLGRFRAETAYSKKLEAFDAANSAFESYKKSIEVVLKYIAASKWCEEIDRELNNKSPTPQRVDELRQQDIEAPLPSRKNIADLYKGFFSDINTANTLAKILLFVNNIDARKAQIEAAIREYKLAVEGLSKGQLDE